MSSLILDFRCIESAQQISELSSTAKISFSNVDCLVSKEVQWFSFRSSNNFSRSTQSCTIFDNNF